MDVAWVTGWVGRRRRRNFVVILPRRVSLLSWLWFFGYLEQGEKQVREEGGDKRNGKGCQGRTPWYLSTRFQTGSDHGGLSCWSSAGVQERWIKRTWSDLLDVYRGTRRRGFRNGEIHLSTHPLPRPALNLSPRPTYNHLFYPVVFSFAHSFLVFRRLPSSLDLSLHPRPRQNLRLQQIPPRHLSTHRPNLSSLPPP